MSATTAPADAAAPTPSPAFGDLAAAVDRLTGAQPCDADVTMLRWRDGGGTDLGSLTLVCGACHHRVHAEGWTVLPGGSSSRLGAPPGHPVAKARRRGPRPFAVRTR